MIRLAPLPWGTPAERERRNRIRIAVYAYAYEFHDEALVSDAEYDQVARAVQPHVSTGHPALDRFFRDHYSPDTGMWIRLHPDLPGINRIYRGFYVQ